VYDLTHASFSFLVLKSSRTRGYTDTWIFDTVVCNSCLPSDLSHVEQKSASISNVKSSHDESDCWIRSSICSNLETGISTPERANMQNHREAVLRPSLPSEATSNSIFHGSIAASPPTSIEVKVEFSRVTLPRPAASASLLNKRMSTGYD